MQYIQAHSYIRTCRYAIFTYTCKQYSYKFAHNCVISNVVNILICRDYVKSVGSAKMPKGCCARSRSGCLSRIRFHSPCIPAQEPSDTNCRQAGNNTNKELKHAQTLWLINLITHPVTLSLWMQDKRFNLDLRALESDNSSLFMMRWARAHSHDLQI